MVKKGLNPGIFWFPRLSFTPLYHFFLQPCLLIRYLLKSQISRSFFLDILVQRVWHRAQESLCLSRFLCEFEIESESRSVVSDSLRPHGLYSPCNSPGQNTGVGSHSFIQGIFPTQGSSPGLPNCSWILYQLSLWCRKIEEALPYITLPL